jgi:hypothetical protein
MKGLNKFLLALGVVIFLTGLSFFLGLENTDEPPRLKLLTRHTATNFKKSETASNEETIGALRACWYYYEAPVASKSIIISTPAPVVISKPVNNPFVYLGTVQEQGQARKYYLKNNDNGQLLTLIQGENRNGWVLKSIEDNRLKILGPGGSFEISY